MRERLAEVWEHAFPETQPLGARIAGGFLVGYALLSLGVVGQLPTFVGFVLVTALLSTAVDLAVGVALLREHAAARPAALIRVLLGVLALLALGVRDPLWLGSQVFMLVGMGLLLLGEPGRGRIAAGLGLFLVLLWPLGTHLLAPFTQRTPLAGLQLEVRRMLEPGPVSTVQGEAYSPYRLRFPDTGWRQFRPGVLPAMQSAERVWIQPETDATVFVKSYLVPAAAAVDLDGFIERYLADRTTLGKAGPETVESVTLDGPFDAARRLHLRDPDARRGRDYLTTLWVRGDRVFEITAHVPRHRFPGLRAELEGILDSFVFQPPRRTALAEETLAAVNLSTVMVLTAEGSGSGFIVESGNGRSLVITNDHVLRGAKGQLLDAVGVVLQDQQGTRSLLRDVFTETLHTDPSLDLAVVRVFHRDTPSLPALLLRHSRTLGAHTPVVVVGYPFGGAFAAGNAFPAATVNGGWVQSQELKEDATRLAVDVGINPGNSGGPLVDTRGRVVGVAVAHRRGSETSFAITTEAVESYLLRQFPASRVRFADPAADEPEVRAEAPAEESLAAQLEARARDATVLVRSGPHVTAGVVVERYKERLLVVASTEVMGPDWKRGTPPPPLTVRAHPERPDSPIRPAEVLRVGPDVLLLAARLEDEGVRPLVPASGETLKTGSTLFALGFKVDAEGRLPQVNPPARLERGILAGQQRDEHDALELLQVDLGINHRQTGGPVFDASGALVGLTVERVAHTNMSPTLTGEQLREHLRGGIRDAAWRFDRAPSGRCEVQVRVVLEDPLGQLESVSLRLGPDAPRWKRWDPRGIPALGSEVITEKLRRHQQWVDLRTELPCVNSRWRLQLEAKDAQGTRRTLARQVNVLDGLPGEAFGRTGGTYLSGDPVPELISYAMEPLSPPESCEVEAGRCERECVEGKADSCWSLGVTRAGEGRQTEALSLKMRACGLGHVEACIDMGFQGGAAKGSRMAEALAPMRALLDRECAGHSRRACNAQDSSYQTRLEMNSERCGREPAQCMEYATLLWNGPGAREQRGQRSVSAMSRACDTGHREACWVALAFVANGNAPGSLTIVAKTLESRCVAEKDGLSCVALAQMHARGQGMPRDTTRATELLELACELREPTACSMLPEHQRE